MSGPVFDAAERARLSDLLDELGPGAPTLLPPWTTRDIAAHLVLRERDNLAAPGLVLPGAWSRFAERRHAALAAREFSWLVATFRAGPPPGFFRIGWVRRLGSLNEFFVHHEDVRRADGRGPRENEPALDEALWRNVTRAPWYLARRLRGTGLELQWAETGQTVRARRGEPAARITGAPGELLLYLFGRQDAARVEVSGPATAVQAVRRTRFGLLPLGQAGMAPEMSGPEADGAGRGALTSVTMDAICRASSSGTVTVGTSTSGISLIGAAEGVTSSS